MKLKNFTAPSMIEAMALVREELGDDAIIISSANDNQGDFCITAAIEEDEINFDIAEKPEVINRKTHFDDTLLRECLEYHGLLDIVSSRILANIRKINLEEKIFDDRLLLEKSFSKIFNYSNVLDLNNPLKMFMGVPGSGKSTAIAKVATQAKIKGIQACVISTDNVRAGANNQLEAFAKILELDFYFCKGERALFDLVQKVKGNYQIILIDTPGINPFLAEEVKKLSDLVSVVKAELILTMDAGKNTYEAVEIADIFTEIGATHLLPTRLDLTRRIGGLLSVANCCELSFCAASVSAKIAQGLAEIDNKSLAKLILA